MVVYTRIHLVIVSIHTPTQGVTGRAARAASQEGFNPHTHAGCDYRQVLLFGYLYVSIHTPTQGVTNQMAQAVKTAVVSIHTPTQGVTLEVGPVLSTLMFQSTHPRRV